MYLYEGNAQIAKVHKLVMVLGLVDTMVTVIYNSLLAFVMYFFFFFLMFTLGQFIGSVYSTGLPVDPALNL